MRRRASVRLLFLVLAVAPTLLSGFAPTAGAISYSARAPITITSDAGFTAANGVVSGSGTLLDPYVISGWHIVAATTPAIQIRDTSAHFVVRDTLVESTSWGLVVVDLSRTGANGTFGPGNVVHHRGTGVSVTDGSPRLHNNTVSGPRPTTGGYVRNAAVRLYASGSLVADNVLVRSDDGVFLDRATAVVRANTFHLDGTGVVASQDTDTTVDANQFTLMSDQAVRLSQSTRALVRANLVQGGAGGILASSSTLVTESNSFVGGSATAINATGSILTATGDVVSGGSGHGLHTSASSVVVTQFNASGLAGTGVRLESTTGNVTASVVTGSGGGIALSASTVRLTGNVLSNNSFGLSVPYDSRLSIPLASGNLVNGVNVDGSLVASDRRLFYLTWGITVDGEIVDSGVSAGFTGIAIREGGIVLYDTKDVNVTNSTFIEQNVGVYAVASRFVSVRFNLFLDNLCGVVFLETEGDVKNNTMNFTIDPPETCGVRTTRGHVVIRNNTIGTVTFGIDVVASTGAVTGNVLFETQTGIRLTGFSGMVAVDLVASGNVVVDARIGIDLVAFAGNVTANDIEGSSNVGIRIGLGGSAVLHANVVADGRVGIGSVACSGISCASATVRANVVAGNEEGMNLTGSFSFRANLATGNSGNGIVVTGSLVSQFDNASGNGANGFVVYGTLDAGNATATANVEAGFRVSGVLSVIHRANVSANGDGIIAIAVAIQLPPPPPPPTVTVPSMPAPPNQDPLIVFDSVIEDNFGYAVQADLTVLTDARYNFWGAATGPSIHLNPLARARGNVVSPNVLFTPWFEDRAMTTTVPPGF